MNFSLGLGSLVGVKVVVVGPSFFLVGVLLNKALGLFLVDMFYFSGNGQQFE